MTSATVLQKAHMDAEEAKVLLNSFTINQKVKGEGARVLSGAADSRGCATIERLG